MTRVSRRYEPDAARATIYAERYGRYCAAIAALKPFFGGESF